MNQIPLPNEDVFCRIGDGLLGIYRRTQTSAKEYLACMRFRHMIRISFIVSLLWLPLPSAQAHAELVSSNPAVGVHLDSLPSRVEVTFDGALLVIGGSKTNV